MHDNNNNNNNNNLYSAKFYNRSKSKMFVNNKNLVGRKFSCQP